MTTRPHDDAAACPRLEHAIDAYIKAHQAAALLLATIRNLDTILDGPERVRTASALLAEAEAHIATAPSTLQSVITWVPVSERLPKPHAKYAVIRNGLLFTATPCYGMHEPWWVVRLMPDDWPNEAEPVPMRDTDLWSALPTPPASEEREG
jgi:hypothetical protein